MSKSDTNKDKELKLLKNSYLMYEASKKEVLKVAPEKKDAKGYPIYTEDSIKEKIELIETMQNDIIEQYVKAGGNKEELSNLKVKGRAGASQKEIKDFIASANQKDELREYLRSQASVLNETTDEEVEETTTTSEAETTTTTKEDVVTSPEMGVKVENRTKYDTIPLPSKGQCYASKMGNVPVSYMTAYDENLIMSPNLYKSGLFLDYLLEQKIMTNQIAPEDMLPGDRDAIVLWLRATSYGTEYPITVTDKYGNTFDSIVDLSKINYKEFTLKGDKNGFFDFTTPVTKDKIKFKFLTYKENKILDKLIKDDRTDIKKRKLYDMVSELKDYIEKDDDATKGIKSKVTTAIKNIGEYADSIPEKKENDVLHAVTNQIEMSIMSVNGITDRDYIAEYVRYMNVKDSSALRRYINENEPGVDYNIEVERPASLGGGLEKTFLTLDQFIFLNQI